MKRLAAILGGLTLVSCATLRAVGQDTLDCAKQNEGQLLSSLPSVVQAAAQQNWGGALDGLAADAEEVVLCDLAALSAQEARASMVPASNAQAVLNASNYLALKKRRVVNVPVSVVQAATR